MLKVIEIIDSDDDADHAEPSKAQESNNTETIAEQVPESISAASTPSSATRPRHQRKSVHHPMRATTPEFETVVLTPIPPKGHTITELVNDVCSKFLNTNEGSALIRQIAEERVRINYLLTSYNMVDIGLTLGTGPERLKTQFEQRMRQRKLNKINNASGEQQPQTSQQQEQTKLNKKRSNLSAGVGGGVGVGADRREEIKKRYSILQNYIPKTL